MELSLDKLTVGTHLFHIKKEAYYLNVWNTLIKTILSQCNLKHFKETSIKCCFYRTALLLQIVLFSQKINPLQQEGICLDGDQKEIF